MSETIVIGSGEDMVERLLPLFDAGSSDFSSTTVVFPGKRPAHFVRKALGRKCGRSFIPPRLYSIDEFVTGLHRQLRPQPLAEISALDAIPPLFDLHRRLGERLGEDRFLSLEAFLPLGMKLFRELEELQMAALPPAKIREGLSGLVYDRLNVLPAYFEGFYNAVAALGGVTRAMRYSLVAENIGAVDVSAAEKIILAGILAPTRSEQHILKGLRGRENVILLLQKTTGEPGEASMPSRPAIHLTASPDMHGQAYALSALLEAQRSAAGPIDERTVVVLPTPNGLFPLVHTALSLMGEDEYNISLGYPLARTPVYGFLRNLFEFCAARQERRFPVAAYLKCVLHPYIKNIRFGQRSDVTRILMHGLEGALGGDAAKKLTTLEEIESSDEVLTELPFKLAPSGVECTPEELRSHLRTIHTRVFRPFEDVAHIGDFVRKAGAVVTYIHEESTAHRHPLFRRYAEAMMELLGDMERSSIARERFGAIDAYARLLEEGVNGADVPFTGTPLRGLQVLGFLETRNLRFDTVYILEANDDALPGAASQDVLLPQQVREALGLETTREHEGLMQSYFDNLVGGAKEVHFFYTEEGGKVRSRFIERLLWEQERSANPGMPPVPVRSVAYGLNLANTLPGPIPKAKASLAVVSNFAFSASALDTYLRCPLRFYYRYVLRLNEKDDPSGELDRAELGSLVHAILREAFTPAIGTALTETTVTDGQLEAVIDRELARVIGRDATGPLSLVGHQVRRHLGDFLRTYQRPLAARHRIEILELESSVAVTKFGFRYQGKLDRVETRDGLTMILDYKTGTTDPGGNFRADKLVVDDRSTWSDAIGSLQLPFYALLYSTRTKADLHLLRPAYVFLGRQQLGTAIEEGFDSAGTGGMEHYPRVEAVIRKLSEEIADAAIPFAPPSDPEQECPRCAFAAICGTQWIKGWRSE